MLSIVYHYILLIYFKLYAFTSPCVYESQVEYKKEQLMQSNTKSWN